MATNVAAIPEASPLRCEKRFLSPNKLYSWVLQLTHADRTNSDLIRRSDR